MNKLVIQSSGSVHRSMGIRIVRAQRAGLGNRRSVRRADALAAAARSDSSAGRDHSGEEDPDVTPHRYLMLSQVTT